MIVKAEVALKGPKGSEKCMALVDTGSIMTAVDKGLAEAVGVTGTVARKPTIKIVGMNGLKFIFAFL